VKTFRNDLSGLLAYVEKVVIMRKEYDFSKAKKNPYASLLKRQVTIRLDEETVKYFKQLAADAGIPYQTLINLYLRDCASSGRKLSMQWREVS
jgi:predicted DNA binding CopG/RHH family protein